MIIGALEQIATNYYDGLVDGAVLLERNSEYGKEVFMRTIWIDTSSSINIFKGTRIAPEYYQQLRNQCNPPPGAGFMRLVTEHVPTYPEIEQPEFYAARLSQGAPYFEVVSSKGISEGQMIDLIHANSATGWAAYFPETYKLFDAAQH